jgi:hypothetical protein
MQCVFGCVVWFGSRNNEQFFSQTPLTGRTFTRIRIYAEYFILEVRGNVLSTIRMTFLLPGLIITLAHVDMAS